MSEVCEAVKEVTNSVQSVFHISNFPAAVVKQSGLKHNIQWMQAFADHYRVNLAPHGKTTMTPAIFKMQVEAGAWGMTLATVEQVITAHAHGIKRVIMANQLVGKQAISRISNCLNDNDFTFYCLVDSKASVDHLVEILGGLGNTVNVLLEVGVGGGRAGCRDASQVVTLANYIQRFDCIRLCGIEFYEGVIHSATESKVAEFVNDVIDMADNLQQLDYFVEETPIISGAGSAWYDVVAATFCERNQSPWFVPVIRPGCYVTHDQGIYAQAQQQIEQRNQYAAQSQPSLISCLEVWAYVLSVPEPGVAIVGLGKRNCAFDAGLPEVFKWLPQPHAEGEHIVLEPSGASDTQKQFHTQKIMDQHCMVKFPADHAVQVGDLLGFTTSHPCLTFDKWRNVLLVDDSYAITRVMPTYF